jgi:hypothetical protein
VVFAVLNKVADVDIAVEPAVELPFISKTR